MGQMTKKAVYAQRFKTIEQRFWEKVDKSKKCWLWTSAVGDRGYGIFWLGNGKSCFAHRWAYEDAKGPIPKGLCVMHSCDTPLCVNPEHLSVGTNKENGQDAARKGRTARGTRNGGGVKLTEGLAAEIRRLSSRGVSCVKLSKLYGVSKPVILGIKHGRLWKHV